MKAARQVLEEKMVKRKVSLKALDFGRVEEAAGATATQVAKIQAGISSDKAKEINKLIKGLGPQGHPVQTQGDQVRVTGKKRDDLQAVIEPLKEADSRDPPPVQQLPRLMNFAGGQATADVERSVVVPASGCRCRGRPRGGTCR